MELSAFGDGTPEELPAESVGVAVLGFGHAPVRRGCAREPPAGAELGIGSCGPSAVRWLGHGGSRARHLHAQETYGSATTVPAPCPQGPGRSGTFDSARRCRRLGRFPYKEATAMTQEWWLPLGAGGWF